MCTRNILQTLSNYQITEDQRLVPFKSRRNLEHISRVVCYLHFILLTQQKVT